MKVLITGSLGFIGTNFVNFIQNRIGKRFYNEVLLIDKYSYASNIEQLSKYKHIKNLKFINIDLCNLEKTKKILINFKPELIINFAAESHVDKSIFRPDLIFNNNTRSILNLLQGILLYDDKKKTKLIHISTDEVFGSLKLNKKKFNYSSNYDPKSPYSASKASSEHIVNSFKNTYGIEATVINCSNNYGPFQYPEKLIPLVILKCLKNEKIPVYGSGNQIRDWIHVLDHCKAIDKITKEKSLKDKYLIGGGNEIRNIDMIKMICNYLSTIKKSVNFLELITYVKDRKGHDFRYAIDISQTKKMINWSPKVDISIGIKKTINWYLLNERWLRDRSDSKKYKLWMNKNYLKI